LLIALLVALFVIIWREYQKIAIGSDLQRRSYGRLVVMREIDGQVLVTGESYALLPITSLGRSPTNIIPINDTFASSEHAIIALRNGRWWLEDRHSRNGTLLNDLPVNQPMIITQGDVISIGKIKFRLELES
jgi:pSer/pThr/pTyr-binding forkhead associated (FHA) protein